jgi:carbohydrate diacid regulator
MKSQEVLFGSQCFTCLCQTVYDEKYDRTNFVKNVILDNILAGDVYLKAKELHYPTESPRAVFVIRLKEPGDYAIFDTISNLFSDKIKDFVVGINETDIALVKEVKPTTDAKELEKIAKNVSDTLLSEANVKSVIGIERLSPTSASLPAPLGGAGCH